MCVYVSMCVYVYCVLGIFSMYVCVCVCVYVSMCVFVCVSVCMCVACSDTHKHRPGHSVAAARSPSSERCGTEYATDTLHLVCMCVCVCMCVLVCVVCLSKRRQRHTQASPQGPLCGDRSVTERQRCEPRLAHRSKRRFTLRSSSSASWSVDDTKHHKQPEAITSNQKRP